MSELHYFCGGLRARTPADFAFMERFSKQAIEARAEEDGLRVVKIVSRWFEDEVGDFNFRADAECEPT